MMRSGGSGRAGNSVVDITGVDEYTKSGMKDSSLFSKGESGASRHLRLLLVDAPQIGWQMDYCTISKQILILEDITTILMGVVTKARYKNEETRRRPSWLQEKKIK